MSSSRFRRCWLAVGGTICALTMGPMASAAFAGPTESGVEPCSPPPLSQPFLSIGDSAWYMPAPGLTPDQIDTSGWTLTGGAGLVSAPLPDGQVGQVLDLPSGAVSVSPAFCITAAYVDGRAMIRDVAGAEGVQVSLIAAGAATPHSLDGATRIAQINGDQAGDWTLTGPFFLAPIARPGQERVRLVLTAGGAASELQIDGLWLDPRMTG